MADFGSLADIFPVSPCRAGKNLLVMADLSLSSLFNSQVTCNYCKTVGHCKSQCPKLLRLNSNNSGWKRSNNGQKSKAAIQLVQEQEPDFYDVEGQDQTKGNVSITQENRGKIGVALNVSGFTGSNTWIINYGASDHMTYDKSFFVTLSSPSITHVSNANGESFPVLGIGSVQVTPSITLYNALYVPSLSHHLLSMSQLNTQNKCSVTFYPMYVIFQDLCTRVIIRKGDLRERLFHLDCMYGGSTQAPSSPQGLVALTLSSDRMNELWLWHRRLGHPSFGQKVVARSSAEAEYRGMARGVCEMLWLRHLLRDLGFKQKKAMPLFCDNKAAVEIAHNPVQHDRTKHVEVDKHFIKEKLDQQIISFPFVPTEVQLADILTKVSDIQCVQQLLVSF
ncbi:putative RNA-directed DNA polymerase [Rosa chinensis]|uniref:Putative RNA-directed DNA polymerase n=1 Tax=Rosa chinensis TaxID=74649 RepID=A0A2P6PCG2_ROSCH|nr:putative RNA-directed DNA polymerase [Rosa chinensis]